MLIIAVLACTRMHWPHCQQLHVPQLEADSLLSAAGATGTATSGGVLLRDVLKHARLSEDDTEAEHIQFEGLGSDMADSCKLQAPLALPRLAACS